MWPVFRVFWAGGVESRKGARPGTSVSRWFPFPAHQTGRAHFGHPAFRQTSPSAYERPRTKRRSTPSSPYTTRSGYLAGSGTSAQAAFHIYDPNGRKIGEYTYTATAPWSRAQFQAGLSKDIWYLGSKRVDMSEDQVGSNWDQTQYYPWGQVQAGQQPSETQGFGTYVLDGGSGLYYADQRYYNQSWGRFLTPDPSNANVDSTNPGSWNRYAYTNGDPLNGFDPNGTDSTGGAVSCSGGTPDGEDITNEPNCAMVAQSVDVTDTPIDVPTVPSADPFDSLEPTFFDSVFSVVVQLLGEVPAAIAVSFPTPLNQAEAEWLKTGKIPQPKESYRDDLCYAQYLDDTGACGEMHHGEDDTNYEQCMEWAWLNLHRCKQGQPPHRMPIPPYRRRP